MNVLSLIIKIKLRIIKNKIRTFSRHSRLKVAVVTTFALGFWIGGFFIFYEGFVFVNSFQGLGSLLLERLFHLLFMALFYMLIFSNIIVAYTTFYRSRETLYLFSLPLNYLSIFSAKLIETFFLSSWALLFLSGPLMLAYGLVGKVPLSFYPSFLIYFLPFALISAGIGAGITMILVCYFPLKKTRPLIIMAVVLFIAAVSYLANITKFREMDTNETVLIINQILQHLELCRFPLLPNYWAAEGLLSAAAGQMGRAMYYFALLLSNALLFLWISFLLADRLYYKGWTQLRGSSRTREYLPGQGLLMKFTSLLSVFKQQLGAMVIKDTKIFWRDPAQWSQFVIFFGLLAVYVANLRNMAYDTVTPYWKNIVSFLNLSATSLTMSTLNTRFVFPQLSLEGNRFWILSLAPVKRSRILLEKFFTGFIGSLLITEALIIGSNIMLKVSSLMMWVSIITVLLMNFALVGLSVGLGAVFPDFKEDNPASIVSGFGGTLVLVLSLFYVGLVMACEALPFHLYITGGITDYKVFIKFITASGIFTLILSMITCVVPMTLGLKNLEKIEL